MRAKPLVSLADRALAPLMANQRRGASAILGREGCRRAMATPPGGARRAARPAGPGRVDFQNRAAAPPTGGLRLTHTGAPVETRKKNANTFGQGRGVWGWRPKRGRIGGAVGQGRG